jgi:hypothetical protein
LGYSSQLPNGYLFFGDEQEDRHKYHMWNWKSLTQKEFGGHGILYLMDLNLYFLASWIQRYHEAGPKICGEPL